MPAQDSAWNMVGHTAVCDYFDRLLSKGAVGHAYAFVGPRSVGKMSFAWRLAGRLLDTHPANLKAHPDLVVVQRELNPKTKKQREQISVAQIQEARARFQQSAMHGGAKVLIIEDAQYLSDAAANALLKTLEEPRGRAHILLTVTSETELLETIRSRVQQIRFSFVPREVLCDALVPRVGSREQAHVLAGLAAGSPGVALTLAENQEAQEQQQDREERASACLTPHASARVLAARGLLPAYDKDHVKTRTELLSRINVLEMQARDALLTQLSCTDLATREVTTDLPAPQLVRLLDQLPTLRTQLQQHLNPKLALIQSMLRV